MWNSCGLTTIVNNNYMLLGLRTISLYLLSVAMTLLLAFRVLPHHHHTLHLPGTLATVETMHLGAESCDGEESHQHDSSCDCPGEKILYYTLPCDDIETYKFLFSCEFSPILLVEQEKLQSPASAPAHAPPYIVLKIPDKHIAGISLRAPPAV